MLIAMDELIQKAFEFYSASGALLDDDEIPKEGKRKVFDILQSVCDAIVSKALNKDSHLYMDIQVKGKRGLLSKKISASMTNLPDKKNQYDALSQLENRLELIMNPVTQIVHESNKPSKIDKERLSPDLCQRKSRRIQIRKSLGIHSSALDLLQETNKQEDADTFSTTANDFISSAESVPPQDKRIKLDEDHEEEAYIEEELSDYNDDDDRDALPATDGERSSQRLRKSKYGQRVEAGNSWMYVCHLCKEKKTSFYDIQDLTFHMREYHILDNNSLEGEIQCSECDSLFHVPKTRHFSETRDILFQHMLDEHDKHYCVNLNSNDLSVDLDLCLYHCYFCSDKDLTFTSSKLLRLHLLKCHVEEDAISNDWVMKCPHCDVVNRANKDETRNRRLMLVYRFMLHQQLNHIDNDTKNFAKIIFNIDRIDRKGCQPIQKIEGEPKNQVKDTFSREHIGDDVDQYDDYTDNEEENDSENNKKFHCGLCDELLLKYKNKEELFNHIFSTHMSNDKDENLCCPKCDWKASFSTFPKLSRRWFGNRLLDHLIHSHEIQFHINPTLPGCTETNDSQLAIKGAGNSTTNEADVPDVTEPDEKSFVRCPLCPLNQSQVLLSDLITHFQNTHNLLEVLSDNRFVCNLCQASMAASDEVLESFTHHLVRKHSFKRPSWMAIYKCENCFYETLSRVQFSVHELIRHPERRSSLLTDSSTILSVQGRTKIACHFCGQLFNPGDIDIHRISCKNPKDQVKCVYCDKLYKGDICLQRHIKIAHENDGNRYSCSSCDVKLPTKRQLENHTWDIHGINLKGRKSEQCELCGKIIPKTMLPNHMKKLHSDALKCDTCETSYTSAGKFERHKKKCNQEVGLNICDICGKQMVDELGVEVHKSRVHNINSYRCSLCKYVTQTDKSLKRHMSKVHPGGMNDENKCTVCQKQFSSRTAYENHMFVKHGINLSSRKTLQCSLCGFETLGRLLMNNHMKSHSKSARQCDKCKKTYHTAKSLENHMRNTHSKKDKACTHCSYRCTTKQRLIRHIASQHLSQKFNCTYCIYTTVQKHLIENHLRKVHGIHKEDIAQKLTDMIKKQAVKRTVSIAAKTVDILGLPESMVEDPIPVQPLLEGKTVKTEPATNLLACQVCNFCTPVTSKLLDHMAVEHDISVQLIQDENGEFAFTTVDGSYALAIEADDAEHDDQGAITTTGPTDMASEITVIHPNGVQEANEGLTTNTVLISNEIASDQNTPTEVLPSANGQIIAHDISHEQTAMVGEDETVRQQEIAVTEILDSWMRSSNQGVILEESHAVEIATDESKNSTEINVGTNTAMVTTDKDHEYVIMTYNVK